MMDLTKEILDVAVEEKMKPKDLDWVHVNVGGEGTGKSALALEMAEYVDPEFSVDQIVFSAEEFISTATSLDPFQAIVFDEGIDALYSRNAMKKENKQLIQFLRQCRELNLFIIINMPSWREMDKSIRYNRTKTVGRAVSQGWAHFYRSDSIGDITYDSNSGMKWPDPDWKDAWPNPTEKELWKEYKKKKKEKIKGLKDKYLGEEKDEGKLLSPSKFAEKVGVSRQTINNWCKKDKIEYKTLFNGNKRIPESEVDKVIS